MWKPKKISSRNYKLRAWLLKGPPSHIQQYMGKYHQLQRTLNGLLLISVISCTAPISILRGCRSRVHHLLHLIWMASWYGFFALVSYWEFTRITLQKVSLDRYLNAVESGIYIIHIASILLLTLQWRHRISYVLEDIVKSDMERGYSIDSRRSKRFIRFQLLLVWTFTCLAICVDFWSKKCDVHRAILSITSFVMPNIISSLSFVQYYVLLREIAWRQEKVTDYLERELYLLAIPRKAEIQKFRLQHAELTHFTRLVNRNYQYSIVLLFVGCFLNFNLVLFLVYQGVENPALSNWPNGIYMLLWLAMHMGKVLSILYFNQKVLGEHTRCLIVLNGTPNPHIDLQDIFNHFILQLTTDVRQHVAAGIISLDLKFLTTLLVASADFFIFLLQYDVTYEALAKSVQGNITRT
nr:putative gustatory receptor 59f [Drosophila bipectinata]